MGEHLAASATLRRGNARSRLPRRLPPGARGREDGLHAYVLRPNQGSRAALVPNRQLWPLELRDAAGVSQPLGEQIRRMQVPPKELHKLCDLSLVTGESRARSVRQNSDLAARPSLTFPILARGQTINSTAAPRRDRPRQLDTNARRARVTTARRSPVAATQPQQIRRHESVARFRIRGLMAAPQKGLRRLRSRERLVGRPRRRKSACASQTARRFSLRSRSARDRCRLS
jgi:hypothetical protein